jgi:hypothetical protein
MLVRWQHHLLSVLGAAALLMVLVNALLFTLNRDAQNALNQRQQFIQQTVPVEALYRDIVKSLAEVAVKDKDKPLLDMLAAQGLTITASNPTPPAAPATPPPRSEKK